MALLAGCGGDPQQNAVSRNEVANALAAIEVRPGLWEVSTEIVDVRQEGLPVEIANRMKGPRPAFRHCVTPQQAARPDAGFLGARSGGRCRDEAFAMEAGRISGTMVCRDEGDNESRVRMSGRYAPEQYRMQMEMETAGIGEGRRMTLVTRQTGRRIGDCRQQGEANS